MTVTSLYGPNSPFDEIRQVDEDGEHWSARSLYEPLGYSAWERFQVTIDRARLAITNSGLVADDHVRPSSKLVAIGSGAARHVQDYRLTRYGSYVVAMNGDPRKPEIAAAQTYFAVKAREAEIAPALNLPQDYPAALRALAAEAEAKAELEAKVQADAPKVGYVDRYVADGDLLTLRTLASSLDVGEQWLRTMLLDRGWIYSQETSRWSEKKQEKETIRRYSAYSNKRHYFEAKPVHDAPRFRGEVMHTLKVTPAGAEAIARLVERNALAVAQ